jgi:hypothetical protein
MVGSGGQTGDGCPLAHGNYLGNLPKDRSL